MTDAQPTRHSSVDTYRRTWLARPHELRLGGSDDISNLKPLDRSVNASFGSQINQRLRDFQCGESVPAFAIC